MTRKGKSVSGAGQTPARGRAVGPFGVAIAGLLALAIAMGIGRFAYTPILPDMVAALGLSAAAAGAIASANYVGYLAGALLLSFRGTVLPPGQLLIVSLIVSAATTGAMGAVPADPAMPMSAVWVFALVRFVSGLASAFALILATAAVIDRLQALGRPGLAALHWGGVGAGIALSAVLVSSVTNAGGGWSEEWLACGLVCALLLPVIWRLMPDQPSSADAAGGETALRLSPAFWMVFLSYALFGFGYVITATFIVAIVRDTPQIVALEPYVWLTVGLAMVPANLGWQWLATRAGLFAALASANLLLALGIVASVLSPTPQGIFFAALCLGASITSVAAQSLAGARLVASADPRQIFGIMTVGFGVGQCAGPYLAGILADRTGDFVLASLMAGAAQVGAAIFAGLAIVFSARHGGVSRRGPEQ